MSVGRLAAYKTALLSDPANPHAAGLKYCQHRKCIITTGKTENGKLMVSVVTGLSEKQCLETLLPHIAAADGVVDFV